MGRRFISSVVPFLERHPRLKALARRVQFLVWHLMVRIRTLRYRAVLPDPDKMYWINPQRIEYALIIDELNRNDKYRLLGGVIRGNWDLKRTRFSEAGLGLFHGLEDRFVRRLPWVETEFYKRVLDMICGGTHLWGCRNKSEWDERCRHLDSLYHAIEAGGYRAQQEIETRHISFWKAEDEITIRIGRDGALLFEDGQHRLAMAKLLKIDEIPVRITARHTEWYRFRKEVLDYARSQPSGKLYHPITHPDLADIPALYGNERFEIIKSHMPVLGGDLLDIGAHWGYFCHKFEEQGFNCYAVESHAPTRYFLEKLKVAENRRFKIIYGSIFDYDDKTDFDVVLALNIFHHFIKTERYYHCLVALLKRLRMKVMFFQTELPDSPQMIGAYRNFNCNEFVEFILENSVLKEAMHIGETENGRPIYRLQIS